MPRDWTSLPIGAQLPYPWPKINGIFTTNQSELIADEILSNKEYYISDKIHGCNLCVSSQGWIASRNAIIAHRNENLFEKRFNKTRLEHFPAIFNKLDELKTLIHEKVSYPQHILLYGELVLEGTANTHHDIYNYEEKKYLPGEFYIFAIGLVDFQKNQFVPIPLEQYHKENALEYKMKQTFNNVKTTRFDQQNFGTLFTSLINPKNVGWLDKVGLESVRFLFKDHLQSILTNPYLMDQLKTRQTEGFVLSCGSHMLKLKYVENLSMAYMQPHLDMIAKYLDTFSPSYMWKEKFVVASLQSLVDNDTKWINSINKNKWNTFLDKKLPYLENELKLFNLCTCLKCT